MGVRKKCVHSKNGIRTLQSHLCYTSVTEHHSLVRLKYVISHLALFIHVWGYVSPLLCILRKEHNPRRAFISPRLPSQPTAPSDCLCPNGQICNSQKLIVPRVLFISGNAQRRKGLEEKAVRTIWELASHRIRWALSGLHMPSELIYCTPKNE